MKLKPLGLENFAKWALCITFAGLAAICFCAALFNFVTRILW